MDNLQKGWFDISVKNNLILINLKLLKLKHRSLHGFEILFVC
jgi:hypothetical protein